MKTITESEIILRLEEAADGKYAAFNRKLIPGAFTILGVRIPRLRQMAKEIAATDAWREFVLGPSTDLFETGMLRGLTIGYAKTDIGEYLSLLAAFVPSIDNWAVCDCMCSTLGFVRKHRAAVLDFITPYLTSEAEFEVRFAAVMLMDYYCDEEYIDRTLDALDTVRHTGYYARMGTAWALSMAYVKFPEKTASYMDSSTLDNATFNMTIRKIIESRQTTAEQKQALRGKMRK